MLNCQGLWISIFIGRLFLHGHLCVRCDVILTNRKIYRQLGSGSQSNRQRGELCMRGVWGRGSISKVWFRSKMRAGAGHSNTYNCELAPGATHSTREHKHAGQRRQDTRTMRGPASLQAMRAACQPTPRMPHRCPPTGDPAVSTRLHVQADPNTNPACKAQSPPR